MNKLPLISVIVPVYNVESYLVQCLDSILNQTYQNFEVILINDGSMDGSTEICREYASKDQRIMLIEQSNQGLSSARNLALRKVTGEYITFLDSDDFLSFNALEIMLDSILENQADLCIFGMVMKNAIRTVAYNKFKTTTVLQNRDLIFKYVSTSMITSTVWAKMYRSELFDGLSFPVGKIHEDAYVMPELLHRANRAVCIPENLYVQNIRDGSIMRARFSKKYLDIIDCEEHTMNFISTHYPEWYDRVAYLKCNAIASVLAKILIKKSYAENHELYDSLYSMLLQEHKKAQPFVTSNTKIVAKYKNIIQHPLLFKIRFYNEGIIQRIKNRIKYLVRKIRS